MPSPDSSGAPPDTALTVWRTLGWAVLLALLVGQVWGLYLMVPGSGEPYVEGQDKVAHVVLFGVPTGLALLLGARLVALGILLHALVSEPLQALLTTSRSADVWDLVADLVGIALAVGVVLLFRATQRRGSERPGAAVPATVGSGR